MSVLAWFDRVRFYVNRIRQKLWVKPLIFCVLSVSVAFVAKLADGTALGQYIPDVTVASVEALLSVMSAGMLVIATFAVGSMVSAYASTSSAATPRAFSLVVADDVSQTALSTFIGAFIFSIVALTALKNEYFEAAGIFTLFVVTLLVLVMVILTFVRWVDRIARLGRIGTTIRTVEEVTADALKRRAAAPAMHGVPAGSRETVGEAVFADTVGYVQRVDVAELQSCAECGPGQIAVAALPGTFVYPGRPLAYVSGEKDEASEIDRDRVGRSFLIGDERLFDDDPRMGFVVLSEIAGRALSPAVNDPGTAIDIVGRMVRLFTLWRDTHDASEAPEPEYDRVFVPELDVRDMFDDAFTSIARDGAGAVEVALRLQKGLRALDGLGDDALRGAARDHGRMALKRAEEALRLPEDIEVVREVAKFAGAEAS